MRYSLKSKQWLILGSGVSFDFCVYLYVFSKISEMKMHQDIRKKHLREMLWNKF